LKQEEAELHAGSLEVTILSDEERDALFARDAARGPEVAPVTPSKETR
jgi:hypothetical protein